MPGWVSYRRIGYRKVWEIGRYLPRHEQDGQMRIVWFPVATRRTEWGRDRLLRYLRRQNIHHYSYRQIRVPR